MNVKRIAASAAAALQPSIIGALSGMSFTPGSDLAFVYGMGVFLAIATYAAPFWDWESW